MLSSDGDIGGVAVGKVLVIDLHSTANSFLSQYFPGRATPDSQSDATIVAAAIKCSQAPEGIWIPITRPRQNGERVEGRALILWHYIQDVFEYEDPKAPEPTKLGF